MLLEPVIGLEIHVQLKTKSKMFCGCSNRGEYEPPNTTVCPVCLGHPGALPVINAEAVKMVAKIGAALDGRVGGPSNFDRKNYFYPDLPKGYQISQKDFPIVDGGRLSFRVGQGPDGRQVTVDLERVHLEEDAAKLHHSLDGQSSYVDYNRSGTPLAEIVTKPDLHSPAEAKAFLQELRLMMRYLGVSDADMEKGHLRCDANISLRQVPEDPPNEDWQAVLNPKTEIKNLNSFRAVEQALEYEIKRQTKLWLDGKPVQEQSTRGWDDVRKLTVIQRSKEQAHDYRYFPEPDLPPMELTETAEQAARRLPELPEARRQRFADEYGFLPSEAQTMCDDKDLADFAERVMTELQEWVGSTEGGDWDLKRSDMAKLVSGWLLTKLRGVLTEQKVELADIKITPENFAELLTMIHQDKVTGPNALVILNEMVEKGGDPSVIMEDRNLGQLNDSDELAKAAAQVVADNPKAVADFKGGKDSAVQFLVGQMMKATRGKAPPQTARELIEKLLKEQ